MKTVVASPGRLGLSVAFLDNGSGAVIKKINPTCTFKDEVQVGDRVVTIDGKSICDFADLRIGNDRVRHLGVISRDDVQGGSDGDEEEEEEDDSSTASAGNKRERSDSDSDSDEFDEFAEEAKNLGIELYPTKKTNGRRAICRVVDCNKFSTTRWAGFCCMHFNLLSAYDSIDDDGVGIVEHDNWTCRCGQLISGRQKRCGVCNKWRGGKRDIGKRRANTNTGARKKSREENSLTSPIGDNEGDDIFLCTPVPVPMVLPLQTNQSQLPVGFTQQTNQLQYQNSQDTLIARPKFAVEKCLSLEQLEEHASNIRDSIRLKTEELEKVEQRMEYVRNLPPRKICTILGCNNVAKGGGGVCMRHKLNKPPWYFCKVEGCTKKSQRRGVCANHGAASLLPKCKIEGCTHNRKRLGVCQRHMPKCMVDGCNKPIRDGGLCKRHGMV